MNITVKVSVISGLNACNEMYGHWLVWWCWGGPKVKENENGGGIWRRGRRETAGMGWGAEGAKGSLVAKRSVGVACTTDDILSGAVCTLTTSRGIKTLTHLKRPSGLRRALRERSACHFYPSLTPYCPLESSQSPPPPPNHFFFFFFYFCPHTPFTSQRSTAQHLVTLFFFHTNN